MSFDCSNGNGNGNGNGNDPQHRVMRYILEKLDSYAHKSHLWQLVHASHIRRNLLRKSRHVSKIHSISEDLVRQCISQLLSDVEKYVSQFYGLISSEQFDHFIWALKSNDQMRSPWYLMQLKRARQLFPQETSMNDKELIDNYYQFIQKKLTPKEKISSPTNSMKKFHENPFQLNFAYCQAENEAKEYLKNNLKKCGERKRPNLQLIDEMIKLGINDMKKIPTQEDFQATNNFLGRVSIFYKVKEAYRSILQNTTDDFLLLRFGRIFGVNAQKNVSQFHKQFLYLLHSFLKSIVILLTALSPHFKDDLLSSIPKIASLFFVDDDSSIIKYNFDLLSPESNVDQWTWLFQQWRDVLRTLPLILTKTGAFSRVIRTTIGIGLVHLGKSAETMINSGQISSSSISPEMVNEQLFDALQRGFYFGIAYALVDCVQDEICNVDQTSLSHFFSLNANVDQSLSPAETVDQWFLIMEQILSGEEIDRNTLPQSPFTTMLIESFDNLLLLTESNETSMEVFQQFSLLLRSQRMDRKSFEEKYNDEQLYLGSVLKSHFTLSCATHLGNLSSARLERDRLWSMPFLGQLTDDCRDFNDDVRSSCVTSFTYYAKLFQSNDSTLQTLTNPFEMFLNVCLEIYSSSGRDSSTGAFLGRRIVRSLRAIEMTKDEKSFDEFLQIFCSDNFPLFDYFANRLRKQFPFVTDPEKSFFRAIDLVSVKYSRTNRRLETFIFENLSLIENALNINSITSQETILPEEQILLSAMNYSVKAGGKRIRMFLVLILAELFGIEREKMLPLACGIEYLHTSSLIFDDLPAQDNSDLRRGRATLHQTSINDDVPQSLREGRAQLAAVDLIAVSMNLINHGLIQQGFSPAKINQVVGEISLLMHSLCIGQMMDLCAAHGVQSQSNDKVDDLDRIACLKTGKTLEAVLITPAILSSERSTLELDRLRELSRLMGILFQMRDDMLDVESTDTIGKPTSLDLKNNTMTYVTVLGLEATRQRLQQYLQRTLQLVDDCWPTDAETIKDVVRHIVSRKA